MPAPAKLFLDAYRDLVSLDAPYVPPVPPPDERVAGLIELAVAGLMDEKSEQSQRVVRAFPDEGERDARALLRALLTVRRPGPMNREVQRTIDQILQAEKRSRPRVNARELPRLNGSTETVGSRLALWQGDITELAADAIVNAANAELLGCFRPFHACIDNAIHSVAGPQLREDCARIIAAQGFVESTGQAKATRAYNLPSRFVLHTVGPIVHEGVSESHERALAQCYRACLDTAAEIGGVESVAVCSISTGAFGYPRGPAANVALETVSSWLLDHPGQFDLIVFVVFNDDDRAVYESVLLQAPASNSVR